MIGRGIARAVAVAGVLVVLAGTARADVFNVSTAQELQSALTQAAGNGVADTINLAAGYYVAKSNFNRAVAFDLTVRAGKCFRHGSQERFCLLSRATCGTVPLTH